MFLPNGIRLPEENQGFMCGLTFRVFCYILAQLLWDGLKANTKGLGHGKSREVCPACCSCEAFILEDIPHARNGHRFGLLPVFHLGILPVVSSGGETARLFRPDVDSG